MYDDRPWGRVATVDPMSPSNELDAILAEAGVRLSARNTDPRRMVRAAQLLELLEQAQRSEYHMLLLKETMTTSDFPILFGDILDRQLLGNYQAWPTSWPAYAKRGTVRDFRDVRRVTLDGLNGRWYPDYLKPEMTAVKEGAVQEGGYTYHVDVFERGFAINWRMLVNDDLDAFNNLATQLAVGARRSEDYFATTLFVDVNGPHASLYTAGNRNIVTTAVYPEASDDNPPLSIQALQDAMTVLRMQRDPVTGEPIFVDTVVLVVPPALEVIANNILFATTIRAGGFGSAGAGGGTADMGLDTVNWMRQRVKLVVNPYIPIVASTANGNTSWFLFADPNVGRPAMEIGFLRGYEQPRLYQKASNTMLMGGGVDQTLGDFETGELRYKGRHVFGGTRIDPIATIASNGSGT